MTKARNQDTYRLPSLGAGSARRRLRGIDSRPAIIGKLLSLINARGRKEYIAALDYARECQRAYQKACESRSTVRKSDAYRDLKAARERCLRLESRRG